MEINFTPTSIFTSPKTNQVPIPSDNPHPNSRYFMPKVESQTTGKGNKTITIITNLSSISKSIRMPENILLKFIGLDLGTQTILKKSKGSNQDGKLKGGFSPDKIQASLDQFLWKYSVCQGCDLPEIYLKIQNKVVRAVCNSCGENYEVDNEHRIAGFIVKNPPGNQSEIKQTHYETLEKKMDSEKGKGTQKELKKFQEDEVDEINMDLEGAEKVTLIPGDDVLERIVLHMKLYFDKVTTGGAFLEKEHQKLVYQRIKKIQFSKGMKDRVDYVLLMMVFDQGSMKDVAKRLKFLKKILKKLKRKKKYQVNFLLSLMQFVHWKHSGEEEMRKLVSTILMKFFEEKIIKEKIFNKWNDGDLDKKLKKSFLYDEEMYQEFKEDSEEFLNWLENQEESSSSSDDSDSD